MEEILTEYCWAKDAEEAKMIRNYLNDANMRKIIIKQTKRTAFGDAGDRIKYNIRDRKIGFDYTFQNIDKLKVIDGLASDAWGNTLKGALKGVRVKDFELLYKIASKPEAVKSLTARVDTKIITPETFGKFLGRNLNQFADVADFESFLKNVPLSEITDAKTLKIVMKSRKQVWPRLAKGEKLKDIIPDISKNFVKVPTTITPEVVGATEEEIAKNLASSRTVRGIPGGLETWKKLDKYVSFKKEYEDAHKLPTKAERDIKNAEIDKRLAKQLIKDGKKLEDIIEFTPDQKAVYDLVQKDVEEIKALKAGVSRKTWPTATTELAYKTKIKNMIAFERQLGEFTGEELSAFNSLNKLEFKTYHIIELLELRKTNTAIKNVLVEWADVGEIVKTLKAQKSATVEISEGLMTAIETVRIKSISKVWSEVAIDFARILLKLAWRILKI